MAEIGLMIRDDECGMYIMLLYLSAFSNIHFYLQSTSSFGTTKQLDKTAQPGFTLPVPVNTSQVQ